MIDPATRVRYRVIIKSVNSIAVLQKFLPQKPV